MMTRTLLILATLLVAPLLVEAADRPNVVWILSEDNSHEYLKLYSPHGAATPAIDKLAEHGVVFDHAFSCGPVCSVARTTLMTSVYAPRLGTQYHRKIRAATLPEGWNLFPAYLRESGYHTTNNSKEDYNTTGHGHVWDESSRKATWRNRKEGQSFFHMHTFGTTHEGSLHFPEAQFKAKQVKTDPASVTVPPMYPATDLMRFTIARYHDNIQAMDQQVGKLVADLEKDGLLEDTFIFYFGDHGGVLPGSKGYLFDRSLHVPLVVRVPEKWKHLVDRELGSRAAGFVSFVDFGPTVLQLAGVEAPTYTDGRAFLGSGVTSAEVDQRDTAFGYADRFDGKYDFGRSIREGRYRYVRNFQAMYPNGLHNNYRYQMLAFAEWRDLYRDGKLNEVQSQFFRPSPVEALYDIEADPYETFNLAGRPEHAERVADLRAKLTDWLKAMPDLSFFPESVLVDEALANPIAFGQQEKARIGRLIDTANLACVPFAEAEPQLRAALNSEDPWQRYWALIVASIFAEQAEPLVARARELTSDPVPLVRLRAAEFLAVIGEADPAPVIQEILKTTDSPVEALIVLQSVVFLRDGPLNHEFNIDGSTIRAKNGEVERRISYLRAKN
jgi:uncharacterized sulfatase